MTQQCLWMYVLVQTISSPSYHGLLNFQSQDFWNPFDSRCWDLTMASSACKVWALQLNHRLSFNDPWLLKDLETILNFELSFFLKKVNHWHSCVLLSTKSHMHIHTSVKHRAKIFKWLVLSQKQEKHIHPPITI